MNRRTLTELAANPDLISGIYNYCDRWCEKCQFTSRCLLYATEQEDADDSPGSRDIQNAAFWQKLGRIFQETKEMMTEWAEEAGVDLTDVDDEAAETHLRRHDAAMRHRLAVAGERYASAVTDWFNDFAATATASDLPPDQQEVEQFEQFEEASNVIHWYQYQIAVKSMRALSSRSDEVEEMADQLEGFPKDSDGSAKVALVGIDRSISAWRLMQLAVPERSESIVPLIFQLERLRKRAEKEFPNARSFIRPGFDEVLGEPN
ncbi:MAG TPA: hypothetical protein VLA93_00010 [Pyrinomonadaceae bacterium]|nr:hypothetical protein [Pyrinomonadaceae bacterium]